MCAFLRRRTSISRGAGDQASARRSLLPFECFYLAVASLTRTQRRDSDSLEAFHVAHVGAVCAASSSTFAGAVTGLPGVLLAGQSARTEQLHQALFGAGR